MPRKIDRTIKVLATGSILPYRDPESVEALVGKRRAAVQIGTGFYDWPLWRAHPTWQQYNEQLANARTDADRAALAERLPPYKRKY